MEEKLKTIIASAVDFHVHIGPEVIPRKYTAQSLASSEAGKLKGAVLKNHFYPTAATFDKQSITGMQLYGSIVLNNAVGGMNAEAVYAASLVAPTPLIVWFPTINAEQFLKTNKYEIAPEWVTDKSLKLKAAKDTEAVRVARDGALLPGTMRVIQMIAQVKGVLATGHIAWEESVLVATYARSLGVPVIVTHPIYQHIKMPIRAQKNLAAMGCLLEQSFSMYSMDKIPLADIAEQIRQVGVENVVLSSDVGQPFSPSPSDALLAFSKLLIAEGFSINDLKQMLVVNPNTLLTAWG